MYQFFTSDQFGVSAENANMIANGLAWPALLRKLDRIDPSFRN